MLEIQNLEVAYGSILALHGVSLHVPTGKIVTLIGANGAGKSTTLRAISGLQPLRSGTIHYKGTEISRIPAHKRVGLGLSHVPEGRMIFSNLSVRENLLMGAYLRKDRKEIIKNLDYVHSIFPRLLERASQSGGTLSGGEQQMLAIGRALMASPRCLMLDEPSLGIAPILVDTIFEKIVEINRQLGLSILLIEQNANLALEISHYGYVMETGRIAFEGGSEVLRQSEQVKKSYLGG